MMQGDDVRFTTCKILWIKVFFIINTCKLCVGNLKLVLVLIRKEMCTVNTDCMHISKLMVD